MSSFRIRVSKDYTVFAAAHFASYEGGQVEPLHGHNYRVAVTVVGGLDEHSFVFNFVPLKKILRAVCDRLDHRLLLPTGNPLIDVQPEANGYVVRCVGKTYLFPAEDVMQLPLPNTTVERLAEWIGGELEVRLRELGAHSLRAIEVEVEETFGQMAACRREIRPG